MVALELAARLLLNNSKPDLREISQPLLSRGEHPDLHLLTVQEEKKEISIEQVRHLLSELQLQPYYSTNRIAIIDDAHLLSGAASNALLLTLEEPPRGCYLILVTDLPHRLLPTILSRSQEMSFGRLPDAELRQILAMLDPQHELKQGTEVLDGSLATLELAPFRRPAVPEISPSPELTTHLRSYFERQQALNALVERALGSKNAADALSAAAELTGKEISQPQMMQTLLSAMRRRMTAAQGLEMKRCAEGLLSAIETSRLITERNLSAPLQMSELLISLQEH